MSSAAFEAQSYTGMPKSDFQRPKIMFVLFLRRFQWTLTGFRVGVGVRQRRPKSF